ncbi:helix-hairpin-helix domain-containing protein [Streptomyces sp. NPDC058372]|uniref:helix-hairpin-helix domain-containing protein n=1 Tax=Streptomyces sp. NPDC058372 TaxID=3346464 RepID=UPI0036641F16
MVLGSSFFGVGVRDAQGSGGGRAGEGADAVRTRAEALLGAGGDAGEPVGGAPPAREAEAAGVEAGAWDDDRRIAGHPWWRTEGGAGERGARRVVTGDGGREGPGSAVGRDGHAPVAEPGPRPGAGGGGVRGEAVRGAEEELAAASSSAVASAPEGPGLPDEPVVAEGGVRARTAPEHRSSGSAGWVRAPGLLRARCGMEWRSVAALVVVAVVAVVWAAQHFWTGRPEPVRVPEAVPQAASVAPESPGPVAGTPAADQPSPSPSAGPLVVDVSGKVARPGVHRLPAGSRVEDALEAAGGVRPGTDTSGLNRARLLTDGEQVAVGVDPAPDAGPGTGADPGAAGAVGAGQPISLGAATAGQLETLPGVGPVLAGAIIAYRTENGGFQSVDQLRDVRGIGDRRFEDLRELVRP